MAAEGRWKVHVTPDGSTVMAPDTSPNADGAQSMGRLVALKYKPHKAPERGEGRDARGEDAPALN